MWNCVSGASVLSGCATDAPADDVVQIVEEPVVVCPMGATTLGVDVSRYSGTVDWAQVKASGRLFGFARISDGTTVDSTFSTNWAGMKEAGVLRGGYQFFRPTADVVAQANVAIAAVGVLGPGDFPLVLDLEIDGGLSNTDLASKIKSWIDLVEAQTGKAPIIYTGKYFWDDYVASSALAGYPLWVAHWMSRDSCPNLPKDWTNWLFWQYTAEDQVPGVTGDVDGNLFNGDQAALEAFAGVGALGAGGTTGQGTGGAFGGEGSTTISAVATGGAALTSTGGATSTSDSSRGSGGHVEMGGQSSTGGASSSSRGGSAAKGDSLSTVGGHTGKATERRTDRGETDSRKNASCSFHMHAAKTQSSVVAVAMLMLFGMVRRRSAQVSESK